MDCDSRHFSGQAPAKLVSESVKQRIEELRPMSKHYLGREKPCLAIILVGERKDSLTYVRLKKRLANEIGIEVRLLEFPVTITRLVLVDQIKKVNRDPTIDGLIVQVPLPDHLDVRLCQEIDPAKDVDGFHFANVGKLAINGMDPLFLPCTPRGIMELLRHYRVNLHGAHVVVVGRSNVVGMPLSLMMLAEDATVTVCHSKTKDLKRHTHLADVLVLAIGKPLVVKADWVKDGAVIVDVGISVLPDEKKASKQRICGDVDAEDVLKVHPDVRITPVPGGVGPMTVAMLMKATLESFERLLISKEIEGEH